VSVMSSTKKLPGSHGARPFLSPGRFDYFFRDQINQMAQCSHAPYRGLYSQRFPTRPACRVISLRWNIGFVFPGAIAGGGLASSRKHEQGLRRGGGWAALEPAVSTGLTDENEVPSVADVAVTSVGDTWCMGCHRLACGDSTDANTVRLYSAHRNRT
jgi:hypothetical protein